MGDPQPRCRHSPTPPLSASLKRGDPHRVDSRLRLAAACTTPAVPTAPTAEARGEGVPSFQLFPDTAEQARALGGRHGFEGFEGFEDYCTDRARHPRSAKFLTWSSIDRMVSFDAFRFVELIVPRPLLMVVGRQVVTPG
ncbi:hypothetical protein ACFWP7_11435 [Streptomyces sp. NPDC058470]|uniref:hypothetical protein n=1 Tax=Streptomyces sp. NPDC058470 TaxID=3346515 RepID=UPI00365BE268